MSNLDASFHDDGEDFVEHYGKKGMRWGQRKVSSKPSSDAKKVQSHRGKPASSLSNKQLRDVTNRINLEQNYSRLHPTKVAKGKKHARAALAAAGTAVAVYNMANSPAGKSAIAAGKKFVKK